jgi:hypothetical protein
MPRVIATNFCGIPCGQEQAARLCELRLSRELLCAYANVQKGPKANILLHIFLHISFGEGENAFRTKQLG